MRNTLLFCIFVFLLLAGCGTNTSQQEGSSTLDDSSISDVTASESYVCRRIVYKEDGNIAADYYYDLIENAPTERKRIEYSYREDGAPLSVLTFVDGEKDPSESVTYLYDNLGNLISVMRNDRVIEEYKYDDSGNCIFKKENHYGDPSITNYTYVNGILSSTYEEIATEIEVEDDEGYHTVSAYNYYYTTYDSLGRILIQKCVEAEDSPYEDRYEYRADGYSIKTYDMTGELEYTFNVKEDSLGRALLKESIPNYDSPYGWKEEYQYDESSIIISRYDGDGILTSVEKTMSDEQGNLISSAHYDADGNLISSYQYEYDEHMNVTQSITVRNGETIIEKGPDRTYYDSGVIKEIVMYSDVEYIAPIYYTSTPKDCLHQKYEW